MDVGNGFILKSLINLKKLFLSKNSEFLRG